MDDLKAQRCQDWCRLRNGIQGCENLQLRTLRTAARNGDRVVQFPRLLVAEAAVK
jgi:hypothetical protein